MKKKVVELMAEASRRKRTWDREKNYLYHCSSCGFKSGYQFRRCPECEEDWKEKKELFTKYNAGEVF